MTAANATAAPRRDQPAGSRRSAAAVPSTYTSVKHPVTSSIDVCSGSGSSADPTAATATKDSDRRWVWK